MTIQLLADARQPVGKAASSQRASEAKRQAGKPSEMSGQQQSGNDGSKSGQCVRRTSFGPGERVIGRH